MFIEIEARCDMKWIITFSSICVGLVVAGLLGLWASGGDMVELELHGYIALGLGVLFTMAVGVGLMALVFHSHRSGQDDQAHGVRHDPGARD